MEMAIDIAKERKEDILLVLNWDPHKGEYPIERIADFGKSIVRDERYHLYILKFN